MNKVLVVTTEGCQACYILNTLIGLAIQAYGKPIETESKDFKDVDKDMLKRYNIGDFPTAFLIKDDKVVYYFIGTRPVAVIGNLFKEYFE